jgi:hypothetical protein
MRDSEREPGVYPRHSPSGPTPNQPARPRPKFEPTGQPRQPARRSGMAGPDPTLRPRPQLHSSDPPHGRPRLPSAEETREAQFERTERLRALRQDFLDHAQTKIKPQKPRNIWLAVGLTGVLLVICIIGIVAAIQLRPTLFSNSGGQTVTTQFMDDMQQKNYSAAYANCASNVLELFKDHNGALTQKSFIQQAQAADQLGPITSYKMGASTPIDSNNERDTVSVTRKQQQPVSITIDLTKGDDGTWRINGIDSALFPSPPPPSATPTTTPTSNLNLPDHLFWARRRFSTLAKPSAW